MGMPLRFHNADAGLSPRLKQPNEACLIEKILAGDSAAFAALVQPYLPLFTFGIHRILQDDHDTQEALQEALLSIHSGLRELNLMTPFPTWAYRVCLNEALSLRRSRMRRKEDGLQGFISVLSPGSPLTEQRGHLARAQESQRGAEQSQGTFREKMTQLSDDQKAVYILRDLEGMETDDVARKMGISRALVRQHLQRARLGLRGDPTRSIDREAIA
jgi:RNA polymerase sigma-70 factor, ECF subfamily